ncbi:MAG: T9SS type A sorting domain-containing protein [Candidatus Zixiibacteriota bacterium]
MPNRYSQLFIVVLVSVLRLLLNQAFADEKDGSIKDTPLRSPIEKVEKTESSFSQHTFPWYVIATGGGSTSSGSHTMKLTSIGQVFTDKAQSGNYMIFSGYISTATYPYTEVKEVGDDQVPYSFELFQNYPNPFNPTTNIRFSLPRSGHVKLDIYNILGKRVTTLVDEDLTAGNKLVTWDGRNDSGKEVASGVYFYKLKAGEYSETKKMILMK